MFEEMQLKFQFHKGAIRTTAFRYLKVQMFSFQFHKGAIRTDGRCDELDSDLHFNSIKVRLELDMVLDPLRRL